MSHVFHFCNRVLLGYLIAVLLIHRLDVDLFEFFRDCWAAPDNEISGNQALKILLFPLKRPLNDTQINGVNFKRNCGAALVGEYNRAI